MSFDRILAQTPAITTLRRALASGKIPHAYLFSGPPGVGKRTAASVLAKALNCTERTDDACDGCQSCRKIEKGVHPDVFGVTLPNDRKSIPVESIRDAEKRLGMRPHEGAAKVVIIEPADKMTPAAANALLKTLEEPGPGRYLILITHRMSSLLPTVRSRCQLVRFHALPEAVVRDILTGAGHDETAAVTVAALAQGSVEKALAYLDEATDTRVTAVLDFLLATVERTPLKGLEIIEQMKQGKSKARDEALAFVDLAPTILSELLWIRAHGAAAAAERPLVRQFGDRLCDLAARLTTARISALAFAMHHAEQSMLNNNMNPQLALEAVLTGIRSPHHHLTAGSGFLRT